MATTTRSFLTQTPAPLSAKLLKNGTLKTYKGFPHGMPTTEAATINADLLAFIKIMKVILFGATGMVGQGVLRECLDRCRRHGSTVGRAQPDRGAARQAA